MSYKFNPCTTCPCETTSPPDCTQLPMPGTFAFHSGVHFGMQQLRLSFYVSNADAPPPWNTLLITIAFPFERYMLLLTTDGTTFTRPGPRPDGINVQLITAAIPATTPNPAVPYQKLKSIESLTFTRGIEVVAFKRNPDTGMLIRDNDLSTVNVCFGQLDSDTILTPRIYQENTNLKLTASFAGFGIRPACNALNELRTYYDRKMPLPPVSSLVIDGHVVPDLWNTSATGPGPFSDTSAIKIATLLTRRWSSPASVSLWQRNFQLPVEAVFDYTGDGYSLANPIMGRCTRSVLAGPVALSALQSFGISGSANRIATDPFTPGDFTRLSKHPTQPIPNCAPLGTFGTISEIITP